MSFIRRYANACSTIIIPICLVVIGSISLLLLGYPDFALLVSMLGTVLTVLGVLAYIVFHDSRSRWPQDHWFVRFRKIITFKKR